MGQNFIGCDREQELLLPPSLREWLPANHLVWFVLDVVGGMDLDAFTGVYRCDGQGRPAHDPAMMVALLVYAYSRAQRSSRGIERACIEDIAFRVVAANRVPDHTTIARFRQRHQTALGELFGEVLALCADAGLTGVEVLAVDSTKVHANASGQVNLDYEQIAREILEQADKVDAQEDEQFGDGRGDELPPELATSNGRASWFREAKRQLDERRAAEARLIPKSRPARLKESKRRLEKSCGRSPAPTRRIWPTARGVMRNGRRLGTNSLPNPYVPPDTPAGKINTTDLDSRNVKTPRGYIQGYNAKRSATSSTS